MGNLTGRKLGKYELAERLAQGGMAEVYRAFQPSVERWVVVKVLHCHLAGTHDFIARFQREARATGSLHHPNIVRIIDAGMEDEIHYIVMDYIAGGTLAAVLKQQAQPSIEPALALAIQLADALAYAHRQGVIHRDIKPANIMFADEGRRHAVLTDFGLARLCHDTAASLTVTGALVGTPTYMSPEAVRGETTDARTDIYSLGVVVYELLTGKPPYVANTPYSMMMKHTNEPLPPPRTLNPALPVAVEEVLLRALAKDAGERFQDAAGFAHALRQLQAPATTALPATVAATPRPSIAAPAQPTSTATPVAVTAKPAPAAVTKSAPAVASPLPPPGLEKPLPPPARAGWQALAFAATGVSLVTALATYWLMHL
jgi:eukaryotic-like serine/threonine-protein kinase